jgi:methionine-rich copper-binding protein CopC
MKSSLWLAAAALAICAGTAQAHAKLETSEPKASSTLDSAPKAVRLQFNEPLEPAFSKIMLRDAANNEVALPKAEVDKSNAKVMSVPLPALRPGEYQVQWSTVSHDGHKAKGDFRFRVR